MIVLVFGNFKNLYLEKNKPLNYNLISKFTRLPDDYYTLTFGINIICKII